jgi:hypothetical protein
VPRTIEIPPCLLNFLARLYPDIDLDRVRFHRGVPFYAFPGGAITIGHHVYFRENRADFCSRGGVALAAHELYHIRQGSNGPGFWFFRLFYAKYLLRLIACGFKTDERHAMEAPAYALQKRVSQHFDRARQATNEHGPCACTDDVPAGLNQRFIDAFFAQWSETGGGPP